MRCHSFSSHSLQSLIGCDTRASCSERWRTAGVLRMVAGAGDAPGQKVCACSGDHSFVWRLGPLEVLGISILLLSPCLPPGRSPEAGAEKRGSRWGGGGRGVRKCPWPQQPEVSLTCWTESIVGGGGRRKRWFGALGGERCWDWERVCASRNQLEHEREREREEPWERGQPWLWERTEGFAQFAGHTRFKKEHTFP